MGEDEFSLYQLSFFIQAAQHKHTLLPRQETMAGEIIQPWEKGGKGGAGKIFPVPFTYPRLIPTV